MTSGRGAMTENGENTDDIDMLLSELLEPKDALPPSRQERAALGMPSVSKTPSLGRDDEGSGGKDGK